MELSTLVRSWLRTTYTRGYHRWQQLTLPVRSEIRCQYATFVIRWHTITISNARSTSGCTLDHNAFSNCLTYVWCITDMCSYHSCIPLRCKTSLMVVPLTLTPSSSTTWIRSSIDDTSADGGLSKCSVRIASSFMLLGQHERRDVAIIFAKYYFHSLLCTYNM